jgi:hypothetical protein
VGKDCEIEGLRTVNERLNSEIKGIRKRLNSEMEKLHTVNKRLCVENEHLQKKNDLLRVSVCSPSLTWLSRPATWRRPLK